MSKTKAAIEVELEDQNIELKDLNKKLEKLLKENEKQQLIIEARENELSRLGAVKPLSLITNPLLATAKKDSTGKKETLKNSPFEVGKMPIKFQVTSPLPGSFDESDVRKIPYPVFNGSSTESRLQFAANLASYVRAGGTKTLMQAGDYSAVEEIMRKYSEFKINESITNSHLVGIIYEQETIQGRTTQIEKFFSITQKTVEVPNLSKSYEIVKEHLRLLAQITDMMVFNDTYALQVLETVKPVIGPPGVANAKSNIILGKIGSWRDLEDFIKGEARERDTSIEKLKARGVLFQTRKSKMDFNNQ